ncbi:MAG: LysR substrate-binding domain-containing protein [Bacteroidales bacterium]|jgi:LysR family hydrogen peroxide-inducible transcriptional activator
MTIQQLEYVLAVDKYRHFVKASEACGVTQSTLSSMIQKLENELDIIIFNRNSHPVEPTKMGEQIISQAKVILYNTSQIKEMVLTEKNQGEGNIKLGIIPTIAPYILPKLFKEILFTHPNINLNVSELTTDSIIDKLHKAELDMAILATPLEKDDLLEIPLYYEKFVAYISPNEPIYKEAEIISSKMPSQHMWVLKEGHCLRNQVFNFCDNKSDFLPIYEAGNIDTLIRIVDENNGYTIIPELHINLLNENQKKNIRSLTSPQIVREVSLVVRQDYVREKLLNNIAELVKEIIPEHMIDAHLKKYAIKL